jgi:hypothetical protein
VADEALAVVQCDGCGQSDNHPMIHVMGAWQKNERTTINDPSFHFDCLPDEYRVLLIGQPQHAVTNAAIEAAEKGTHGDKLRAFIAKQEDDNNVPDEVVYEAVTGEKWTAPDNVGNESPEA